MGAETLAVIDPEDANELKDLSFNAVQQTKGLDQPRRVIDQRMRYVRGRGIITLPLDILLVVDTGEQVADIEGILGAL